MKCPKCGYTSFDYQDACKKCSTDLRDARTLLQIIAVSPEDRAPNVAPTAPPPPEPAAAYGNEPRFASEPPPDDTSELLEDLDFEESFEGLVERTSYEEPPAEGAKKEEDDQLLDLDFGDIFGEEGKK